MFCNDRNALEDISYTLQRVLDKLNFRMNSQKTKISGSVATDAVKPEKLFYIFNTPIASKKRTDFDSFEKHLLYILMFASKYPDCGYLRTLLSDIGRRIKERIKLFTYSNNHTRLERQSERALFFSHIVVLLYAFKQWMA